MRTTLILPDHLPEEARQMLGFTSTTETVVYALREVVRRGRRDQLKALLGRVSFEVDPAALRARDRRRGGRSHPSRPTSPKAGEANRRGTERAARRG